MITKQKLTSLISVGEGYYFETKAGFNKNLAVEATAFANSSGGIIVLGVNDQKQKVGLVKTNRLISQVQDVLNSITPQIKTEIYELDETIVIEVLEGQDKPYAASSGFYVRIGANSQKLSRNEIIGFCQNEGKIRFDELINHQANFVKDFNQEAFRRFLELSQISPILKDKATLENLGCLRPDGQLTNAGVLMFAKSIDFIMNHAAVICVLYQGDEKLKIIDKKDFTSSLIENIEGALEFIQRHSKTEYVFTGAGRRNEVDDYPLKAVREALVNAVCHRDYFIQGSQTLIEIYKNRLEISNPGGLPSGLKEKDFGKKSLARNPLLASLLYRANYMEKVGTGIARIKKYVANHPKKISLSIDYSNFYTITFQQITSQAKDYHKRLSQKTITK